MAVQLLLNHSDRTENCYFGVQDREPASSYQVRRVPGKGFQNEHRDSFVSIGRCPIADDGLENQVGVESPTREHAMLFNIPCLPNFSNYHHMLPACPFVDPEH